MVYRMREDESLDKRKAGGGLQVPLDQVRGFIPLKLQFSWQKALCCYFPRCHLSSYRDGQAFASAIVSDSPQPLVCIQYVPRCAALPSCPLESSSFLALVVSLQKTGGLTWNPFER